MPAPVLRAAFDLEARATAGLEIAGVIHWLWVSVRCIIIQSGMSSLSGNETLASFEGRLHQASNSSVNFPGTSLIPG